MQPLGPSEVDADSIDVWVVSHGGVASNALCDHMQAQGIRTRPGNYGLICHKQHPGISIGKPIIVIHGDYLDAIRSMDRRKFLTANAAKMCLGINAPEIPLSRFLQSFPEDPVGFSMFLESFRNAKESGLDKVAFLRYPYSNEEALRAFEEVGIEVDMTGFALRERKKKYSPRSKDVKTILEIYTKKVKLADSIDLDSIAQATSGFAGADLANMVNEAALLAARAKRKSVEQQDLSEAIERVVAGLEKKSRVLQDDEKKVVAYHEVGHAIVGHLMPGGSKVAKISIVPRGMSALGYTLQLPTEERFLNSKEELKGQIATLLGGRSAEEVVFGKITTGASNDLQRATDIAEQMVGTFGMSEILGPLAYDKQGGGQFLGNGNNPRRSVSDATAQAIDKEVRDLVDDAHETALTILRNNLPLLESISQKILQEEVIEGEDLKNLLAESKMPA